MNRNSFKTIHICSLVLSGSCEIEDEENVIDDDSLKAGKFGSAGEWRLVQVSTSEFVLHLLSRFFALVQHSENGAFRLPSTGRCVVAATRLVHLLVGLSHILQHELGVFRLLLG